MIDTFIVPAAVLGGIGLFFGILLSISSKIFHVEQDDRLEPVTAALPGANCGGCGYAGCANLAAAILEGKAPISACPVGGKETAKKIAEIMGTDAGEVERFVAHVHCSGGLNAKRKFNYEGLHDCLSASKLAGGPLDCKYGCLGYGSCVAACPYDAMAVENGVAVVHAENCKACGKCVAACPKNLIHIVSDKQDVFISCNSLDKGADLRKFCNIGCIGCGICVKKCPEGAITVKDNLARIDYAKCTNCGLCVSVCPRKLISNASESVAETIAAAKS